MDWNDTRDNQFTSQGYIATRDDPIIKNADGSVAMDLDASNYLETASTEYIHPSLLRQVKLLKKHGLFEVVNGVYQVRGFDITNITFIRSDSGWIVIDPALVPATAKAAYELVSQQLGYRPIKAVIYTHSHLDHFGGAAGIIDTKKLAAGEIKIIAPQGFVDATLREFLVNGNATRRRTSMSGVPLKQDEYGAVGVGLSNGAARGPMSFIPPTLDITHKNTSINVDGVDLVFQLTPGTEAPAEMNIYVPQFRVLDMAENANMTMHNILSPRGVEVRDAKGWADNITESIKRFGEISDVVIVSHGWPRFGQKEVVSYLSKHRDAYKFMHDQTVRMMNQGLLPNEIANRLKLPESLEKEWYNHGYYGSVSFNSRAVYQRYLGWYDANPVNLAPFEPKEEATRYVAAMGGRKKVLKLAKASIKRDDYRWAAELLNKMVMSNADDTEARALLADTYQQMAYWQENGMWRNIYLTGAHELREGVPKNQMGSLGAASLLKTIPTSTLFEMLAVQLNPGKSAGQSITMKLEITDTQEAFQISVENDVLTYWPNPKSDTRYDVSASLMKVQLAAAIFTKQTPKGVSLSGDESALPRFLSWFDNAGGNFPILWRQ